MDLLILVSKSLPFNMLQKQQTVVRNYEQRRGHFLDLPTIKPQGLPP